MTAHDEEERLDSGDHEPGSAMGFLHEMQLAFVRMIQGVGRFLLRTLPEWFYSLFHNFLRVTGKAAVVAGIALAWAAIVFGPAVLGYLFEALGSVWLASVVGAWALIALTGSFLTLAKLRGRNGGVGCVWGVGLVIAVVVGGLLVLAHVRQSPEGKTAPGKSPPAYRR
jgi:hypothetical protein